ncbi:MAG: AMIN-like domain-containing (lipo)protein, partial [Gammaproteobacteria bacterium]
MKMLRYGAVALSLMLVMAGCTKNVKPIPPPVQAPAPATVAAPAAATTQAPAPAEISPLDDPS